MNSFFKRDYLTHRCWGMFWIGWLGVVAALSGQEQELKTHTSYYGEYLLLEYTYYLSPAGEEVYHGDYWSYKFMSDELESHQVYEHGVITLDETFAAGFLNRVRNYVGGQLDGPEIYYDSNGYVTYRIDWSADRKINEIYYFTESTQPSSQVYYGPTGGPQDYTSFLWYADGQLRRQSTYVEGQLEGPYLNYREDGTLETQWTYLEGRRIQWLQYNEQGNPTMEVYADMTMDSPDIAIAQRRRDLSYFGDGETIYRETTTIYSNAATESLIETKTYHNVPHYFLQRHSFERSISEPYSTSFPVHFIRNYHANGRLMAETPYSWEPLFEYNEAIERYRVMPRREGVATEYNEAGILTSETTYKNNKRSGVSNDYFDTGQIRQSRTLRL
jgi:antitoxin component YwqK of YwqJK toxin-antitoxin module